MFKFKKSFLALTGHWTRFSDFGLVLEVLNLHRLNLISQLKTKDS